MPETGRFFGIVIRMFYNDHAPRISSRNGASAYLYWSISLKKVGASRWGWAPKQRRARA